MNILVTGATGFIGRHICATLLGRGHSILAAVRDPISAERRFPGVRALKIDMSRMASATDWLPLLQGVEAVVNCAGILQSRRGQSAEIIHAQAPKALFDACLAKGIRRVIQISAVSADEAAGTEYALTKKAADEHLRSLDLDWVVLRPSLVYAEGSYGGTSLMRGLAGLPLAIPLVGDGAQEFQPIHANDLAETVARCIENLELRRRSLDPVGPETLTLRQIIERVRAWLDLPPASFIAVPRGLMALAARLGDLTGQGPLNSTALAQLDYGNVSDPKAFEAAIGFRPRSLDDALCSAPSHVQDRWHARLYFLGPLLTVILALLWICSGIAGLVNPPMAILEFLGPLKLPAVLALSLLDIGIGLALIGGLAWKPLAAIQLLLVCAYTLSLTILAPALWLEPFGPLLKNLPILAAIAVWAALQDEK